MADSVFKKVQLVGTSFESFTAATAAAVAKATETEKNLCWFEVAEQRGALVHGKIQYQVTLNIGVKLE
jgi:hypothetical protein